MLFQSLGQPGEIDTDTDADADITADTMNVCPRLKQLMGELASIEEISDEFDRMEVECRNSILRIRISNLW